MHVETTRAGWARSLALSPAWFVRFAALELFALWAIVTTGAAVRLTDSGLGCRHWPGCEAGHALPAKDYHAYIEFGNRAVGGVTILITLAVAALALATPVGRRARQLAVALFLGTLAQAPLGYLAVKTDLRWPVPWFSFRSPTSSRAAGPSLSFRANCGCSGSASRLPASP